MHELLFILTLLAGLATALLAGNFFAFSVFIMRALSGLTAERGIVAMQSMVMAIKKPFFLVLFFGTSLLCLLLGSLVMFGLTQTPAYFSSAGAAFFLIGGFIVTMQKSLPLNNVLLRAAPDAPNAREFWQRFCKLWLRWNHVRTVMTFLACACFMLGLAEIGLPT